MHKSAAPQNIIDENGQEKGMLRENGDRIKEAKTSYSAVPPQGNSTLQKVDVFHGNFSRSSVVLKSAVCQ